MKNVRNFDLLSLVPPSLQSDPQVQAAAAALTGELQAVSAAIDEIMVIAKLERQPERVIDHLAWQWHVDFYDEALPLATKRALVKSAIAWHRRKGTPAVVQEMVSTVLSGGVVSEWFEYGGQPYRFRVETDEVVSSQEVYDRLMELVDAVKNVRSWLDTVTVRRTWAGSIYFGACLAGGKNMTIGPVRFKEESERIAVYFGGTLLNGKMTTIH